MPTLVIKTNVSTLGGDTEDKIMRTCSSALAQLTGKPEKFIMVSFETSKMIFGGSAEPCAFLYLASLGALGPHVNPELVRSFSAVLESEAGIPPDRIYVEFNDIPVRTDFGWNNKTFGG
eukprot:GFKZ01013146.1.p1 GENE.GFKZ01013146.1~~GFKZ01013146.1.p1  ORF type:complete len:119 (-),score=12.38 GFKZ01013146.1:119-475(-)